MKRIETVTSRSSKPTSIFIVKAYEEQENDRAARIIRSSYTGDYGEQGKVVLDEAVKQTVHYETGWYEPEILGSGKP